MVRVSASRAAKILVLVVPSGKRTAQLKRILLRTDIPHVVTTAGYQAADENPVS